MASASNTDSWPRDPVADANPELPRKRERLSEETDTSPLSTDDSILVEAVPFEDELGTSYETAIELHDDTIMPSSFSSTFELQPGIELPPVEQLDSVLQITSNAVPFDPTHIYNLSRWVIDHVESTRQSVDSLREAYLDEHEFFSKLGTVCFALLDVPDDIFEMRTALQFGADRLAHGLNAFMPAIVELSIRILTYLPDIVETMIARRDSGQLPKSRQRVDLLCYVQVLGQILALHKYSSLDYMRNDFHLKPKAIARDRKLAFLQHPTALASLVSLMGKLARNHREITNSWEAIEATICIVQSLNLGAVKELAEAMDIAHMHILPVICEKHPRALPEAFHNLLTSFASETMMQLVWEANATGVGRLYDRYIKSEDDALLPELIEEGQVAKSLDDISGGNKNNLTDLFTNAWMLKALKSFIYSDIMDVRSYGISALSDRLMGLFHGYRDSEEKCEHPVLQYVARFMRTNELTKYIFGPNSHASLVNHSQNIIGFLAATLAYTDLETDIIWHACTNSVEAEFVKASFGVLVDLCRYLDLDHLLYLANKYTVTPPSKLGKDAVDSLTDLFQKVSIKSGESGDQRHRLATAFISIDIMMRLDETEDNPSLTRLCDTARRELIRFTDRTYSADDRLRIYARCIPNLLNHSKHSTRSVDILVAFLRVPLSHDEAYELLRLLPIQAAVDELGHYIETQRSFGPRGGHSCLPAIDMRLECIVRLMALPEVTLDDSLMRSLYRCTVGDMALSNESRDRSWQSFMRFASGADITGVASEILRRFLEHEIGKLPLECVTPELIRLFGAQLRKEGLSGFLPANYSLILQSPTWQKLIQASESIENLCVGHLAIQTVCEILFDFPLQQNMQNAVSKCHAMFATQQIDRICEDFEMSPTSSGGSICQKLDLLDAAFQRSKQFTLLQNPTDIPELRIGTESGEELVQHTLHVYNGGHRHPKVLKLHANRSSKLSELALQLPVVTGANQHRIIVGGEELDSVADADLLLSEGGFLKSSVISVCPRHTLASDLSIVLSASGTIEQEVWAQYDKLEKLLDGPAEVASKMFQFLVSVRPPTHIRQRVASPGTNVDTLCPSAGVWRTVFSFYVLKTHLMDFAHLGVADESFLLRGLHIIVSVLVDVDRPLQSDVVLWALECLMVFLQGAYRTEQCGIDRGADEILEQPCTLTTEALVEEPKRFVSRIIDIFFFALQAHASQAHDVEVRRQLVDYTLRALLQAFRRQDVLWQMFKEDARVQELHAQILFDYDLALSANATTIMKNFCTDASTSDTVADFYMNINMAILPRALERKDGATRFFDLSTEIMLANRLLRSDEARARNILQSLVTTLWDYEHIESVDLPIADTAVTGMLKLLAEAVTIVKSFKKPLDLDDFSTQILRRLLFPAHKDPDARPLIHQQSRRLAYQLVQATCETQADFVSLLDGTLAPLHDADPNPQAKYPGPMHWLRPAWKCSGIPNLGMTCYMNSLLQQLFANVHFRKFIFEVPIDDMQRQILLYEVQRLFAFMQDSYNYDPDTKRLAKVLNIQTDSQEDVHGFYEDFLSRLEANMPTAIWKAALSKFFTGKLISQIVGECGHVSPKAEPFVDLPIIVKNKTCLADSLDEFVQGEPMEGANMYKCLACDPADGGRLVNAMKRACPEEMPDNLTFCLKRFTFEAMLGMDGKVNDTFEFPQSIDMSRYQQQHLDNPGAPVDDDLFELVGVIVHQGTLHLGHYWSYTLLRNTARPDLRSWVKLEDRNVSIVQGGFNEVQQECFGGQRYSNGNERADNAYVLFYQRREFLEEQVARPGLVFDPVNHALLPPKVDIPASLVTEIHEENAWRHRISHLFDDDLSTFIEWLLVKCRGYLNDDEVQMEEARQSRTGTSETSEDSNEQLPADELAQKMSQVAIAFIQRVAVCDPSPIRKLTPCISGLDALMAAQPATTFHLLDQVTQDPVWFIGFLLHESKLMRSLISNHLLACLAQLRQQDRAAYDEISGKLRRMHANVMHNPANAHAIDWASYLRFASELASVGSAETAAVLDNGYWLWAFEMLSVPFDSTLRKKYPSILENMKQYQSKVSAVFEFILAMLNGHVYISDLKTTTPPEISRTITESGVRLHREEFDQLVRTTGQREVFLWMRASKYAERDGPWRDSSSAKLLGFLVSQKVDDELRLAVQRSLKFHIDCEEEGLPAILHLILHFYKNWDGLDVGGTSVWNVLARVIHMWETSEIDYLNTAHEVFKMAPLAILNDLEGWVLSFLEAKTLNVREKTALWLQKQVFLADETITGSSELDSERARKARKLVADCCTVLTIAYSEGKQRGRYESVISTVLHMETYLKALKNAASAHSDSRARQIEIGTQLQIELDELDATIQKVRAVDADVIEIWEEEPAAATPLENVRRSVELASEDHDIDTSDDWDEDDDESVLGR